MNERVIFFDGVCNLCNSSVRFVLRNNSNQSIKFATVQSELGKRTLTANNMSVDTFDSMLYLEDGKVYLKSTAALKIASQLSFPWKLLQIFYLIPRPIRDWFYEQVAKNRYQWFGRQEMCLVPTDEIKDRFIDI